MKPAAFLTTALMGLGVNQGLAEVSYPIVDTGQTVAIGSLQGQDAHYLSNTPSYGDNGDGTVTDKVTGLMWTKDPGAKMTWEKAMQNASECRTGGHEDWRLPSIKELYSLIQFSGLDPDPNSMDTDSLIPFIDHSVFDFKYGDPENDERIIDSQFATTSIYTSTTMRGAKTMFGVNFADGRIKGYGLEDPRGRGAKTFHVLYVRGNPEYGKNKFKDKGDGMVTDEATGLTWMKADSGKGMDWPSALKYADGMEFAGHDDWRLPSAKELQSIVDYSRAPDSTASAAIDPVFQTTTITNAGGREDYAAYWSGTTHLADRGNTSGVYVNFGRSLGWMEDRRSGEKQLLDVHGAGAQRSDPKTGDASKFPYGRGPQGDVIGIENMVRLVRGGNVELVDPPVARETRMREGSGDQARQQRPNRPQGQPQTTRRGQGQRQGQGMNSGQRGTGASTTRGGQGGRPRDKVRPRDTEFNEKFPVGSVLPDDLKLYNTDREKVAANSIFEADFTVIVGGCLTCPEYRNSYPEIEAVAADYRDKGVQFYFLFQTLTHPENWGFVQPTSIQERFAQVEHAKELLKTSIPWLADTMDDGMKRHFAMTPNSQFVFDRDGKIVHRDSWGRGSSLREALEKLVGPSEKVTTAADLKLPRFGPHKASDADRLIEPRRLDGVAVPLRVAAVGGKLDAEALKSRDFVESKRYAKLRPEADESLIQTGSGQLYLGFRQDPVLGAAWNNLAEPPRYRIVADGVTLTPAKAASPKLGVESDSEPREFLVDVKNWELGKPIKVQLQYFACNKEKGWCKAVEQEFTVWLEKDQTAGMVSGRTHFPGRGRGGQSARGGESQREGESQRRGQNQGGGSFMDRADANGDGKVSKDEFRGPAEHFDRLDQNGDGFITSDEAPSGPRRRQQR